MVTPGARRRSNSNASAAASGDASTTASTPAASTSAASTSTSTSTTKTTKATKTIKSSTKSATKSTTKSKTKSSIKSTASTTSNPTSSPKSNHLKGLSLRGSSRRSSRTATPTQKRRVRGLPVSRSRSRSNVTADDDDDDHSETAAKRSPPSATGKARAQRSPRTKRATRSVDASDEDSVTANTRSSAKRASSKATSRSTAASARAAKAAAATANPVPSSAVSSSRAKARGTAPTHNSERSLHLSVPKPLTAAIKGKSVKVNITVNSVPYVSQQHSNGSQLNAALGPGVATVNIMGNDGNLFYCHECKGFGDVVCCDGCPHVFHPKCIPPGPSRKSLLNDDDPWFCPTCMRAKSRRRKVVRTIKRRCCECHQSHVQLEPCEGCGAYLHYPSCGIGADVINTGAVLCSTCRSEMAQTQEEEDELQTKRKRDDVAVADTIRSEARSSETKRFKRKLVSTDDDASVGSGGAAKSKAARPKDPSRAAPDSAKKRKRTGSVDSVRSVTVAPASQNTKKLKMDKKNKRQRPGVKEDESAQDGDKDDKKPAPTTTTTDAKEAADNPLAQLYSNGLVKSTPAFFFFLAENRGKIERALSRKHRIFNRLPKGMERNQLVAKEAAQWWVELKPAEVRRYMNNSIKDFEHKIIEWKEEKNLRDMMQETHGAEEPPSEEDDTKEVSLPNTDSLAYYKHMRLYLGTTVGSKPFRPEPGVSHNRILLELLQDIRFHPVPMFSLQRAKVEYAQVDPSRVTIPHFDVHGPVSTSVGDECLGCTRGWNHHCNVLKRRLPAIEHRAKLQPPLSSLLATRIGLGLRYRPFSTTLPPEKEEEARGIHPFQCREVREAKLHRHMPIVPWDSLSSPGSRADDIVEFIEEAIAMRIPEPTRPLNPNLVRSENKKALSKRVMLPTRERRRFVDPMSASAGPTIMCVPINKCGRCRTVIQTDTGCIQCRRAQLVINTSKRVPIAGKLGPKGSDGKTPKLLCVQTQMLGRMQTKENIGEAQTERDVAVANSILRERWMPWAILPATTLRAPIGKPRSEKQDNEEESDSDDSEDGMENEDAKHDNNGNNDKNIDKNMDKNNHKNDAKKDSDETSTSTAMVEDDASSVKTVDTSVDDASTTNMDTGALSSTNDASTPTATSKDTAAAGGAAATAAAPTSGAITPSNVGNEEKPGDVAKPDPTTANAPATKRTRSGRVVASTGTTIDKSANFDDRQKLAEKHRGESNELHKRCTKIACRGILLGLIRRDPLQLFAEPVTAEGYSQMVKKPIDFGKIRKNVLDEKYSSLGAFVADCRLLCLNALIYNPAGTIYSKTAKEMLDALAAMHRLASEWMTAIKETQQNVHRQVQQKAQQKAKKKAPARDLKDGDDSEKTSAGSPVVASATKEAGGDNKPAGKKSKIEDDMFAELRLTWPDAVEMLENNAWLDKAIKADFMRTKENEIAYYGSLAIRRAAVAAGTSLAPYPEVNGIYNPVGKRTDIEDEELRASIAEKVARYTDSVELKNLPTWREESIVRMMRRAQQRRLEGRIGSENGCARCDGMRINQELKVAMTAEALRGGRAKRKSDHVPRIHRSRLPLSTGLASHKTLKRIKAFHENDYKDDKDALDRWDTSKEVAVSVHGSRIHGWGLFADQEFRKGDVVAEYVGEYVSLAVTEAREKAYQEQRIQDYQFRLDDSLVIDATMSGGHARYINHNCNPNCVAKSVPGPAPNQHLKRVVIVAQQEIKPREELTYDYQFPLELDLNERVPCNCLSDQCRGFMNWDLPEKGSHNRMVQTQKRGANMRDRIRRLGRPLKSDK